MSPVRRTKWDKVPSSNGKAHVLYTCNVGSIPTGTTKKEDIMKMTCEGCGVLMDQFRPSDLYWFGKEKVCKADMWVCKTCWGNKVFTPREDEVVLNEKRGSKEYKRLYSKIRFELGIENIVYEETKEEYEKAVEEMNATVAQLGRASAL